MAEQHIQIADWNSYISNNDNRFVFFNFSSRFLTEWEGPLMWFKGMWVPYWLQKLIIHIRMYLTDRVMVGKTCAMCRVLCNVDVYGTDGVR